MSAWQPPTSDANASLSSTAPAEVRKRSLPAHVIEEQKKEAATTVSVMTEELKEEPSRDSPKPQEQGQKLTFFQRYFCKPQSHDPEKHYEPTNLRFSFLSIGFLLSIAILVLAIITILGAVLATQLSHKRHHLRAPIVTNPSPIREAIDANFADPAVLIHNGTWYAMATNNAAGILRQPLNQTNYDNGLSNVQLATSDNFFNWTIYNSTSDPLPLVGAWAKQGLSLDSPQVPLANLWAPSMLQRPSDGTFILFYSAGANVTGSPHCVGAAISTTTSPAGPYTAINTTIACPVEQGGAIDPAAFVDVDKTIYLAYKVDGNNAGHGGVCGNTVPPLVNTPIKLQKMKGDGVTPDGNATTILNRTADDGPLVEAPSLVRSQDGIYFLFFSSGCTRTPSYNVKYAWAHNITGPYTRARFPLLQTGDWGLLAPGSATVASTSTGGFEMAFHARVQLAYGGVRAMFTTKVLFNKTQVTLVHSDIL